MEPRSSLFFCLVPAYCHHAEARYTTTATLLPASKRSSQLQHPWWCILDEIYLHDYCSVAFWSLGRSLHESVLRRFMKSSLRQFLIHWLCMKWLQIVVLAGSMANTLGTEPVRLSRWWLGCSECLVPHMCLRLLVFEKRRIGCTVISIVLIHSFWNFHLRQQDVRSSSAWSLWDGISGKSFGFWKSSWLAVGHGALILFFRLGIRYVASLLRRSFALVYSWSCSLCGCVSYACEDGLMAAHGARWYDGGRRGVRPDDQRSFEDLDPEHVSLSSESCRMNG